MIEDSYGALHIVYVRSTKEFAYLHLIDRLRLKSLKTKEQGDDLFQDAVVVPTIWRKAGSIFSACFSAVSSLNS